MRQAIKCEMTPMNKRSQCIFEKARILALLVLKADLKYMSVIKKFTCLILKNEYFHTICNISPEQSSRFLLGSNVHGNVH